MELDPEVIELLKEHVETFSSPDAKFEEIFTIFRDVCNERNFKHPSENIDEAVQLLGQLIDFIDSIN